MTQNPVNSLFLLYKDTTACLEKFDNEHDFERMCADILNALGFSDVVLQAPRGGKDGGRDITFKTARGERGLACVTLRKDIAVKFQEDFGQRRKGEFDLYSLFCTAYIPSPSKIKFEKYCIDELDAILTIYDIEGVRSLLDTVLKGVRAEYLQISDEAPTLEEKNHLLRQQLNKMEEDCRDLQKAADLSADMEYRGFAYFRKSTNEGPFCSPCLSEKAKPVRLLEKSEYYWECPLCHNVYCSDRHAVQRQEDAAARDYMNSDYDPFSII